MPRSPAQPTPPATRHPWSPAQALLSAQGRVAPTSDPGVVSHADTADPVVCHGSNFPGAARAMSAVETGPTVLRWGARSTGLGTSRSRRDQHPGCLPSLPNQAADKGPAGLLRLPSCFRAGGLNSLHWCWAAPEDAACIRKGGRGFLCGAEACCHPCTLPQSVRDSTTAESLPRLGSAALASASCLTCCRSSACSGAAGLGPGR